MKKILLSMVILFGGVMFASASNDDNVGQQCRFQDSNKDVHNGRIAERTYDSGSSSGFNAEGSVSAKAKITKKIEAGLSGSGSYETSNSSSSSLRRNECCTQTRCSSDYKTDNGGWSDKAKNYDPSW